MVSEYAHSTYFSYKSINNFNFVSLMNLLLNIYYISLRNCGQFIIISANSILLSMLSSNTILLTTSAN